jgi:transcriptional regulator with XRE-family HTH domain
MTLLDRTATSAGPDEETLALDSLGARLRALRVERDLTLAGLAAAAKMSVAMLSHIERGQASPSLRTLERLRIALGVPLATFFQTDSLQPSPPPATVVRASERATLSFADRGFVKQLLSPPGRSDLEMLMLEVGVGGSSGEEPWTRNAVKAGLVLEGCFELEVAGQVSRLEIGDSFQFDANLPHRFRNASSRVARVVWIIKGADPA